MGREGLIGLAAAVLFRPASEPLRYSWEVMLFAKKIFLSAPWVGCGAGVKAWKEEAFGKSHSQGGVPSATHHFGAAPAS
jgi:hypothetical protein